jgi:hypothetical protein
MIRNFVLVALALASSVTAQSQSQTLAVSAMMDIYQAGGYNDGSGALPPVVYSFPAKAVRRIIFSRVEGFWSGECCQYVPWGPDGISELCNEYGGQWHINNPIGPFSGLDFTDFAGALVGMFLEDGLPASAPPPLRFYLSDSSQGGIQTNFTTLSPVIGQVFFIGDGKTGTGAGTNQAFRVPPTATNLYLGYSDSCNETVPGCYGDNVGSVSVTFHVR